MMNDKKFERAAKVISALLFVVSVMMFVMCFAVQPYFVGEIKNVQSAPERPSDALETKNAILVELDNRVATESSEEEETPLKFMDIEVVKSVEEAPVEDSEKTKINMEDVELLAKVIYQEAGSDSCCDNCRRMVADVVLNRVADERFPNTIYDVLMQERQYGRYHWTGVIWPERAYHESEAAAVERAYRIAEEALSGTHSALYGQGYIWQAEFIQGTDTVTCECGGSGAMYFGR